jgi:hypothetical protein
VQPLSPERYRVQLTASAELKRKLELARDLLRHALPSGDLPAIVERALDLLIEHTLKRRFGVVPAAKPRGPSQAKKNRSGVASERIPAARANDADTDVAEPIEPAPPVKRSRYIPNDVRRAVAGRDGTRCGWRGPDGTRCNSRAWLEHDHALPYGLGGASDATNIRDVCRSHNRLAAERTYGRDTIARIIARRRARRSSRVATDIPDPEPDAPPPTFPP